MMVRKDWLGVTDVEAREWLVRLDMISAVTTETLDDCEQLRIHVPGKEGPIVTEMAAGEAAEFMDMLFQATKKEGDTVSKDLDVDER